MKYILLILSLLYVNSITYAATDVKTLDCDNKCLGCKEHEKCKADPANLAACKCTTE